MFELTSQQIGFFDTFGFFAFPGLLSDRIGQIIDDFESVAQGRRHRVEHIRRGDARQMGCTPRCRATCPS